MNFNNKIFCYFQKKHIHSLASQPTSLKSILISSHLRLGLPKGLFPSGFTTKTLYPFLDCSIRATCPAHLSRFDLRLLIMLGEEYNACSSALCNFLHSPVISSFSASNIFLSTLFLNTLNLCSSLKERDQVSQTYNTTGNIILLHVLTFNCFYRDIQEITILYIFSL